MKGVFALKEEILNLLRGSFGSFVSGQEISEKLGVSRTAIWKYINHLKEDGYEIESISKKGYRLLVAANILTEEEIHPLLNTKEIGKKILHFDTIDSTNSKAKELANNGEEHGTIVVSEEQTLGRGRMGRSFVSPKGKGIWMSIILRPDIDPLRISLITQIAAAAVNTALTQFGVDSKIKWPNDIILKGKKVCGILTEMSGELTKINYVVLGIGLNANIDCDDFTEEIKEIATSLKIQFERDFDRKALMASVINNFEALYDEFEKKDDISNTIKICKDKSILIGKNIKVIQRNMEIKAKVLDINEEGLLVVEYEDGTIKSLISGEISIRGY
jgi:BirA family biotin operon repressor/biotin-[acetyl-CoA-carboxylase] ligase